MASQYPPSPDARRALASYLVHDLKINPFQELIPALLGEHTVEEDNGMLTVAAFSFPESLVDAAAPSVLTEAAFVRLVVHCLALAAPIQIMASFALAEHMARPGSALCSGLWQALSFLHIAPEAVVMALQCQRPDIIATVQSLYGRWLLKCRSPQHVAAALELATDLKWNVQSGSPAYATLAALMQTAQIAATPVKHVSKADIVVDNRAGIIISKRDKCLLALILCSGRLESSTAQTGIKAFSTVRKQVPYAFHELEQGRHPLDEIMPI